jgi:hypothetical protein
MKNVWLGGIGLMLGCAALAPADVCIVHDDFTSWTGTWKFYENYPSSLKLEHYNQRAYANCGGHSNTAPAFAWAAPDDWKMDLTQDWAMQADWYINPTAPINGDTGMAFLLLFEGNPHTLDIQKGWSMGAGTYNASDGYSMYESSNRWTNNVYAREVIDYDREIQDTVYVWWDASERRIWVNDQMYNTSNAFTSSFTGFSNVTEAWTGFGAYAIGAVPAFSGKMWVDNICVLEGNALGTVVGACCMDGECVQVPETACIGTFTGIGTFCENDCLCSPHAGCVGDVTADDSVDHNDVFHLLSNWGESLACESDPDGGSSLGVTDLLLLLANWGQCDHS